MELFVSRAKVFKAITLGLLLASASSLLFVAYPNAFGVIFGSIGSLLFGGMTVIFISLLFRTEPQVIINLKGIEDKRLNTGLIGWSEVNAVLLQEINRSQSLLLILESPEKYYRRLPKFQSFLRRANGQKDVNNFKVSFTELDKSVEAAWGFIENNIINEERKSLHLKP